MFLPLPLHHSPHLTRAAWFKGLSELQHRAQATQEDVSRLLGPPDDIISPEESCPFEDAGPDTTVWVYGSKEHLGFSTLGYLCFRAERLSSVFPETYRPPKARWSDDRLSEEIRKLDLALYPRGHFNNDRPEELEMIRAANDLIPLGRGRALDVLSQYPGSRVFKALFLNTLVTSLFADSKDDLNPDLDGAGHLKPQVAFKGEKISVVGGIPLPIPSQADLSSMLHPMVMNYVGPSSSLRRPKESEYIGYYRDHGRFRTRLYHPIDDLASLRTLVIGESDGLALLATAYTDSLLKTVFPHPRNPDIDSSGIKAEQKGQPLQDRIARVLRKMPVKWNERLQCYTLATGEYTPFKPTPTFQGFRTTIIPGLELVIGRYRPGCIDVNLTDTRPDTAPPVRVVVLEESSQHVWFDSLRMANSNDFEQCSNPHQKKFIEIVGGSESVDLTIEVTSTTGTTRTHARIAAEPEGFDPPYRGYPGGP